MPLSLFAFKSNLCRYTTAGLLRRYLADADRIVAESCQVALDIMDTEISGEFVPLQAAVEA